MRLHRRGVVAGAQVGASRAMAAGGRVAAPANHDVVEVLVTGLSPLRCGGGSACVRAGVELICALDGAGQNQERARFRPSPQICGVGTGNGWRHVIEQTGKEAHTVTSASSLLIQCSCDFKNTGNSGNNGNSPVNRGLQTLVLLPNCCQRFLIGNSDNQMKGKYGSLILKMRCALPVVATFFIGWQRL